MAESNLHQLRCSNCGTINRVANERLQPQLTPVCGRCKTPLLHAAHQITITDANFATEALQSPLPVLLDLWAAWCGPCRMIAPLIDELAQELTGRVRVGKLNIDENPVIPPRLNARSIPTLLVIHKGREVERMLGVQPKQEILRKLNPYL